MDAGAAAKPSQSPNPTPVTAVSMGGGGDRDFLLHLEAYLARRDGVDKLLKIARYAAKIAVAADPAGAMTLYPRLKAFESSVGLSRKAFRLGKFVQDVNAFRAAAARRPSAAVLLLSVAAYGGEGLYFFVEQLVWLSKAGLLPSTHIRRLQRLSVYAELIGYIGSITLKFQDLKEIKSKLKLKAGDDSEIAKLREKLLLKQLSVVQDVADVLMAIADLRDGKGIISHPLLLASAGLLSALISTHKNWSSC